MPYVPHPWVPMALGSAAAKAAAGLYRWSDSHYIKDLPPSARTAVRTSTQMRRNFSRTKTSRRRRPRRRRYARVRRVVQPFTISRRLRHVFSQTWNLAAGGAMAGAVCYLNSINDPSGTFAAGQPLGHDQYGALYGRYIVTGWHIKLEICTKENTSPMMVGFTPSASSTLLTEYDHYKESPATVSRMLTPDIDKSIIVTKGGVKKFISPPFSAYLSDDQNQADVGANPSRLLYGHIWAQSVDKSSDLGEVSFVVTLTQFVKYFKPVQLARS